ncbi:unnamed protein product [Didymodactylos carnosus]|uniref:Ubiquitin-like domain-containing protein n=1 Tax=Didymodactylos carnosus TaxID=1234261 RepID=A0A815EYL1_9BILA|nr:unnamed protein product [Didymodactylos carnosus]CAF4162088.1 unnamed protein product [Didymodactylos carnosus]
MVISISLQNNVGKVTSAMLPDSFTLDEFTKMLSEKLGDIEGHRFVMDGKQLRLNDEQTFNQQKEQITNGKVIFVLDRLPGGTDTVVNEPYISKSIDLIMSALPFELLSMFKTDGICTACRDNTQCLTLCCTQVCEDCFPKYFKSKHFKLKCMNPTCTKTLNSQDYFRTQKFQNLMSDFEGKQQLIQNIDCQICRCGALMINDKMYSQQECQKCKRRLCFFCNKDWDESKMKNMLYTCKNNCDYEAKITYELVPMKDSNPPMQIPNRRCCPKCFNTGAYGGVCKYHKCTSCGYDFCFICLESKEDCNKKFAKPYGSCQGLKEAGYNIFPKINDS